MDNLHQELECYYKDIRKSLICERAKKKTIVTEIRTNVECYIENNPSVRFDDIVSHFGSASAIAQSHLECTPADELQRRIKRRSRVIIIAIITAVIALLIYIGALVIELTRFNGGINGSAEIAIEDVMSSSDSTSRDNY